MTSFSTYCNNYLRKHRLIGFGMERDSQKDLVHSLYITDEDIDKQKGQLICPWSHRNQQNLNPNQSPLIPNTMFFLLNTFSLLIRNLLKVVHYLSLKILNEIEVIIIHGNCELMNNCNLTTRHSSSQCTDFWFTTNILPPCQ